MARQLSFLILAVLLVAPIATGQVVRSASGLTPADVTAARDAFRADLGGGTIAGANGSFGGLRREINWDGVPDAFSAPNMLPPNFFNTSSPRGVVFATPGTGFQVSANAGIGVAEFGNLNPSYPAQFEPFSPQRLFTPLGSNVTDVAFFVPGTATPAVVTGFGAVFTDVDTAGTTIQFFDAALQNIGIFNVTISPSGGLSFLGVSALPGGPIARVRITTGNAAPGPNDGAGVDVVVMDDFIYSEPLIAGSADVAIVKTAPAQVVTGVPFNYTLTVTNGGPAAASGVVAADTLPAGMTASNVATTQGSCTGAATVTCTIGAMNSGATVTITITTMASSGGAFSNTATVSATSTDPTPANNSSSANTTAVPPSADLSIVKTGPANVTTGVAFNYTLTVTNQGPDGATGVVVNDVLPAGMSATNVQTTQGSCTGITTVNCTLGTMNNGAVATITITTSASSAGAFSNTATVSATSTDPTPANNSSTANATASLPPADLSISKTGPTSITTGVPFDYTLTVTNQGPGAATGVVVTDVLPTGMSASNVVTTMGSCTGTMTVTCTVGTMTNGAIATITITTTANGSGAISNTATVSATSTDPTPGNNAGNASATATPAASQVPTASTWALLLMTCALAFGAFVRLQ